MIDKRQTIAGMALGMMGVVTFSLTLPMTRIVVETLDPLQVSIWRSLAASIVAAFILLIVRPVKPQAADWQRLLVCAGGLVFGFPIFIALAMQTVSAAHGAVVVGLLPLGTSVASVFISHERPSKAFWAVSTVGTVLTLMFVLRQAEGALAIGHVYSMIAVIVASIGYANGGLLAKRLGGWQVSCWTLIAALPFLGIATFFVPPIPLSIDVVSFGAFTYLALMSQLIGFILWYKGMALAGIARVSQLQLLQLFLTVIAANLILSEPIDGEIATFGSLVVLSVWLSSKMKVST
ncbi:DMT family transporter [Kordiimonas aquimaris]|uniref:DMT family transporter n=1 Tax=Kordiimonas aquimaris TaxID=707591 RepID=UPI0021D2A6B5|nr:DMT family transporter [Kordiimonas aquimaris]